MGQMNWLLRSVCFFFFFSWNWVLEFELTGRDSPYLLRFIPLALIVHEPRCHNGGVFWFFLGSSCTSCSACFHVPNARQVFRFVLRQSLFTLTDPSAASWQLGVKKLGADSVSWWKWMDYRLWLDSEKRWKINFNYIYTTVEVFKNIFHSS